VQAPPREWAPREALTDPDASPRRPDSCTGVLAKRFGARPNNHVESTVVECLSPRRQEIAECNFYRRSMGASHGMSFYDFIPMSIPGGAPRTTNHAEGAGQWHGGETGKWCSGLLSAS
jgi:hypothetical protein